MTRPRFLADNDLDEHIRQGLLRREPVIDFPSVREFSLADSPDPDILEFGAEHGLIIVSHDVNTMPAHAQLRVDSGRTMAGLVMVHQRSATRTVIDDLLLIWSASDQEEWRGEIVFLPL